MIVAPDPLSFPAAFVPTETGDPRIRSSVHSETESHEACVICDHARGNLAIGIAEFDLPLVCSKHRGGLATSLQDTLAVGAGLLISVCLGVGLALGLN